MAHSEEYFDAYRDDWWNADFLALMAARLGLDACRDVLDVGCGQCHWSRLLAPFLAASFTVHALDSDPAWSQPAAGLYEYFKQHGGALRATHGDAAALPFADDHFDLVTCQTVLIHCGDPQTAIREMYRVVRPGGLVLCVEPNNLASTLVKSNLASGRSVDDILAEVRFALELERGKIAAGEGDSSFGDLLPGAMAAAGLKDLRVYLSDKAVPMVPPYDPAEQGTAIATEQRWLADESGPYDWQRHARYLNALPGDHAATLAAARQRVAVESEQRRAALVSGAYHTGGGCLMYLAAGRKPAPA